MKFKTYIKISFVSTLVMIHVNAFCQSDEQVLNKNKFVEAVNEGADSALYLGVKLINELEKESSTHTLLPRVYLSLGNFYIDRDRLPDALINYKKALDVAEKNNNELYLAFANGSIGNVYVKSKRYEEALPVFKKNLKIWKQKKEKELITIALSNIGKCLYELGKYEEALDTLKNGLSICEKYQMFLKKSELSFYISKIYLAKKNNKLALKWALKSNQYLIATDELQKHKSLLLLAEVKMILNKWKVADSLCNYSYTNLKNESKYRVEFLKSCDCLVKTNKGLKDINKALAYKVEYINQKDTLAQLFQVNQLGQIELEHELHKGLVLDSLKMVNNEQRLKHNQQLDKDKIEIINWLGLFLIIILSVTGVYIYKSYQKQKITFKQLAEVNKEITDSINYAKHIQDAFLPDENELNNFFEDSFLFFQPKEIVAGDFYWFDQQGDKMLLAVADCSGYGVPGAMISVVCYGALHEAVRQLGLSDTAKILDLTQKLVAKRFELEDEKMKDGMDISLCIIDSSTKNIKFSGANNSLLILRDNDIIELKGDKQTIGNSDIVKPFITHEVKGKQNDAVYLYSDGYINQLGGEKGKKIQSNNFKKQLIEFSNEEMGAQLMLLSTNFESWKSDYEQIDDICIIGVRI